MDKPTDWRSGTRRIFSNEFKLHMVELASRPNANVAQLAREHGVDNNLIFKWLRLWQKEGRISRRMPPTVVGPTVPQSFPASQTLVPVELINTPRGATDEPAPAVSVDCAASCHVEFHYGKMTQENPLPELLTVLFREHPKKLAITTNFFANCSEQISLRLNSTPEFSSLAIITSNSLLSMADF